MITLGFWDKVGKVANVLLEEGQRAQQRAQQRQGQLMKDAERKVQRAGNSEKMQNPEYARRVNEAKEKLQQAKLNAYTGGNPNNSVQVNSNGDLLFAGKTADQWDISWQSLGRLSNLTLGTLSAYNKSIGLYKAEMNGKVMYIGRAIEHSNGGFRKRLRDYVRDSDSARTHKSGGKMNEHAHQLNISIVVVGTSDEEVDAVKALEKALVLKYAPPWNVQFNRL